MKIFVFWVCCKERKDRVFGLTNKRPKFSGNGYLIPSSKKNIRSNLVLGATPADFLSVH